MPSKEEIVNALKSVADIDGDGNVITGGRVRGVAVEGDVVNLVLDLPTEDEEVMDRVEAACRRAVKGLGGVREVTIMSHSARGADQGAAAGAGPGQDPFEGQAPIEGVKNIIAVSSAKGGVGKSTVCVNLALALARRGARVGLMDADVYGPSVHLLLGVNDRPTAGTTKEVAPVVKDDLKLMSLGFLADRGMPVIWRGPIVTGVLRKFLQDVEWGELDYLMIDMPPGTGDAQLTLVQTVPITGAVIVTTSSELALVDAEKGLEMYRTVNAPVLGIIENMSHFVCPHCGERTDIFSSGGGRRVSERLGTEYLGDIPLDPEVRRMGDEGVSIVDSDPDSIVARAFFEIADRIRDACPAGAR